MKKVMLLFSFLLILILNLSGVPINLEQTSLPIINHDDKATVILLSDKTVEHPIHISVFKLEYRPEKKALQMTLNVFIDDLETVWEKANIIPFKGKRVLDIEHKKNYDEVVKNMDIYLKKNLTIKVNQKKITQNVLGFELKKDAFQFYINSTDIENLNELTIDCSFFLEGFDAQQNLFFLKYGEEEYSARLNQHKLTKKLFP